ncbi:MAG: wax ester/triacylglycerol synthase family O-acyltransferase [Gammaproteobacteria bacterium]|nr:wax ester/triacylglycerol synthase family O-acyltransferase [Gammaproteobacteria bacterium]
MKYLSPVDAAFLRMESLRTPMHVGCMMTFRLPDDAPPDFLRRLLALMRTQPFMPPPFGYRLARGWRKRLAPAWEEAEMDIDYHIRHSALPYPGGERELGVLVSRLHSNPMDFSRPLWECHLIEGLEGRRFAMYFKAHHCAIDGMGAMRLIKQWLSTDPKARGGLAMPAAPASAERVARSRLEQLRATLEWGKDNAAAVPELARKLLQMSRGEGSTVRASMRTPRSLFNVATSQQRRLGTQMLPLARLKAVAEASGAKVNDAALAVVAGAVRRYLLEHDALPERSLTASVPVGLPRTDGKGGNAVAGFVCPLATDEADPARRVQRIMAVTNRAKDELQGMSPSALEQFTLIGLTPLILGQTTGVLAKLPPFFNFVVSNVVASKTPLYLEGAELEAMYPMSILFDGYAVNVTLIGYVDHVTVGFTGCRDAIPHLQRLAVYTGDALAELEAATAAPRRSRKAAGRSRAG